MGNKPKESREDRAARGRERRMTEIERQQSTEESASALSSDLRAIYGASPTSKPGGKPTSPYKPQKGDWNKTVIGMMMNQMMQRK